MGESKPIRVQVPDGLQELIPEYLDARRQDAAEMRRFFEENQFDEVRRLAHNLKGNGACYGFDELSKLGAALEAASKRADRTEADQHIAEITRYLNEVETF